MSSNTNEIELSKVKIRFDPKTGIISITSKDKQLEGIPFKISLNRETEAYENLFNLFTETKSLQLEAPPAKASLSRDEYKSKNDFNEINALHLPLGVSFDNEKILLNFEKFPNLLISGQTNTGKTNMLRHIVNYGLQNQDKIRLSVMSFSGDLFNNSSPMRYENPEEFRSFFETITNIALIIKNKELFGKPKLTEIFVIDDLDRFFYSLSKALSSEEKSQFITDFSILLKYGPEINLYVVASRFDQRKSTIPDQITVFFKTRVYLWNEGKAPEIVYRAFAEKLLKNKGRAAILEMTIKPRLFQSYSAPEIFF